jgi:hypothetical protein
MSEADQQTAGAPAFLLSVSSSPPGWEGIKGRVRLAFTLTPTLPHPRGREAMTDAFRFTPCRLAVRID